METLGSLSLIKGKTVFKANKICMLILSRFRQVPTFGRYTIRRFRNNIAAMKKLTGRDMKDILLVRLLPMAVHPAV